MKNLIPIVILLLLLMSQHLESQTTTQVASFQKVIISPHIETTFVQGTEESVTILENTVPEDKINIDVKGGTLRIYLDDAKETTKHKKVIVDGIKRKVPLYKGTMLTIQVVYKNMDELSLRGEQKTLCQSLMSTESFKLKIYGESQVTFTEVKFEKFDTTMYGEGELNIAKGSIAHQDITVYGEGVINLDRIENKTSRLKAYGEAAFLIQASERIKFTAYGEAELRYKGTANVDKGLSFGDSRIVRLD